jgi:hypothetical protein
MVSSCAYLCHAYFKLLFERIGFGCEDAAIPVSLACYDLQMELHKRIGQSSALAGFGLRNALLRTITNGLGRRRRPYLPSFCSRFGVQLEAANELDVQSNASKRRQRLTSHG